MLVKGRNMKERFYYRMASYDMIEATISISPDIFCPVLFCIPDPEGRGM